jgi:ComF family protein
MKMWSSPFSGADTIARRFARALTQTIGAAANEQDCFLCGLTARHPLCDSCIAACPALPASLCPCCALPSTGNSLCGRCLHTPPPFDSTVAAFAYGAPLNQALQAFKYRAALGLTGFLGGSLAAAVDAHPGAGKIDLIVPMPLARVRLAGRGFNQALELARPLAKRLNIRLDARAVLRVRDTPPQAALPWNERVRNIRGAFGCPDPVVLSGKRVAVVDDVMTTGATLGELAKTLKAAGATHVSNWVVARTMPWDS